MQVFEPVKISFGCVIRTDEGALAAATWCISSILPSNNTPIVLYVYIRPSDACFFPNAHLTICTLLVETYVFWSRYPAFGAQI